MYLVHWKHYEESEATWEPLANLINAMSEVIKYELAKQGKTIPKKSESNNTRVSF